MTETIHPLLRDKFRTILSEVHGIVLSHFQRTFPYNEAQEMFVHDEDLRSALQSAGRYMRCGWSSFNYDLEPGITLRLVCYGGKEMPYILFPDKINFFRGEITKYVDLLVTLNKDWANLMQAFDAMCDIVGDVRELNFYAPWIRLLVDKNDIENILNPYNGLYHFSRWVRSNATSKSLGAIHRQFMAIVTSARTNRRTWMPSQLVDIIRTGGTLITQYNLIKNIETSLNVRGDDCVTVQITIESINDDIKKWKQEALQQKNHLISGKKGIDFRFTMEDEP